MVRYKQKIHDFISLFGADAYLKYDLDLKDDYQYAQYLSTVLDREINPYNSDSGKIIRGMPPQTVDIVNGVWSVVCGGCGQRTIVRRRNEYWICVSCLEEYDGHSFSTAMWRDDIDYVESILCERPKALNRNAYYYESAEDLLTENKENL